MKVLLRVPAVTGRTTPPPNSLEPPEWITAQPGEMVDLDAETAGRLVDRGQAVALWSATREDVERAFVKKTYVEPLKLSWKKLDRPVVLATAQKLGSLGDVEYRNA